MKYFLILISFNCFSQDFEMASGFTNLDGTGLQLIGDWTRVRNDLQDGVWSHSNQDTIRYRFYGFGVKIETEMMPGHTGYQVLINGRKLGNVNTQSDEVIYNQATYINTGLEQGNHIIDIVPDNGYFTFNRFVVYFYVAPDPCLLCDGITDSTDIHYDTVTIEKINYIDEIRWIEKDTTIYNYQDSTLIHYDTISVKQDTLFMQPIQNIFIKADSSSLYFQLK